jgi:IclR family pca regulon transcriptional regulator
MAVLESFDMQRQRLNATLAAERAGITRAAARRHLLTLAHLGYMATDGKLFWLTPRVMRLGQSYLESARLPRIVQPFLQRLTASTHETSYLSVLDGDEIVYVARNGPVRHMSTGFVLGARVPAQVTAAGMLLMALKGPAAIDAWLDARTALQTFSEHTITDLPAMRAQLHQVRQQDWALSEQQLDLDYRGVAVPLRDRMGETAGALSIIMPMQHEPSADALRRVLPLLKETAQSMRNLI